MPNFKIWLLIYVLHIYLSDVIPTCVDFKTDASTENSVWHGLKLVPWLGLIFIKRKQNEIDLAGDPTCM